MNIVKERVFQGLSSCDPPVVIVVQAPLQQIQGFLGTVLLVLAVDEAAELLLLLVLERVVIVGVELDSVFVEVLEELLGALELNDLDELVLVVLAQEEMVDAEQHCSQHAPGPPDVHHEIVQAVVEHQLRALVGPAAHAGVVFLIEQVELGQPPVDQLELLGLVVDHDVGGLHVSMHDAPGVGVVQRLKQLEHVAFDVLQAESFEHALEGGIADALEDE